MNASLWTLPFELKMYGLLLLLGVIGLLSRIPVLLLTLAAGVSYSYYLLSKDELLLSASMARFIFFFFAGSSIYIWRDLLPFHWSCLIALTLCVAVAIVYSTKDVAMLVLALATPYMTLFLALVPSGRLQKFNRCGDYSYGLYIYGFPVQQVVLALSGGAMSEQVWQMNFLISWSVTLIFAIFSWHFVESIALKRHVEIAQYCKIFFIGVKSRCRKTLRS